MGIFKKIKKAFTAGNTLYYPGCLTSFVLKAEAENYKKILEKLGISFITIPDMPCCGSPSLNAGYEKDSRELARKLLQICKEHSVGKIITNCPACFKTFSQNYLQLISGWDIKVEHISINILKQLQWNQDLIEKKPSEQKGENRITYHDPCHLGRHSGIYEEPREILKLLGYEIIEMKNNRENALCCGGGAGLKANNPKLANNIAKKIIESAKQANVSKIITTCPLCFANLMENSDIEIVEFSETIAKSFGLEAKKTIIKENKIEVVSCA